MKFLAMFVALISMAVAAVAFPAGYQSAAKPPLPPHVLAVKATTPQAKVRKLITGDWKHVSSPLNGFDCFVVEAPFARTRTGKAWFAEVCIQNTGPAS